MKLREIPVNGKELVLNGETYFLVYEIRHQRPGENYPATLYV